MGGPALYAETMLSWEIRTYRDAERHPAPVVFFDRGVPDLAGHPHRLLTTGAEDQLRSSRSKSEP